MLGTGKNILLSKTVWMAFGGVVLAIANLTGWHITDGQIEQAVELILFVLTAVFRLMATQPVYIGTPPAVPAQSSLILPDHMKGI